MGVIEGKIHRDERGVVRFVNGFNMGRVVRMYSIEPKLSIVSAWQGHKKETKWFYAATGSFVVKVADMNTRLLNQYVLSSLESQVLEIPG